MRQFTTIELTWNTVIEKLEGILRKILDKNIECKVTQDDTDFWGVGFLNYRMSIPEVEKICVYVNATEEERKDAYPSENETSVADLGVDIANKLLSMSLGISFTKFLVETDCLLLINCEKNERIRIGGDWIPLDKLKSIQELTEFFYAESANSTSLFRFATEYKNRFSNELLWHFPLRSGKHLGAYFLVVKEGVLFLPYDDADKVNGPIFNLDAMRLVDMNTVRWNMSRLEAYYLDAKEALIDIEAYLFEKEKKGYE